MLVQTCYSMELRMRRGKGVKIKPLKYNLSVWKYAHLIISSVALIVVTLIMALEMTMMIIVMRLAWSRLDREPESKKLETAKNQTMLLPKKKYICFDNCLVFQTCHYCTWDIYFGILLGRCHKLQSLDGTLIICDQRKQLWNEQVILAHSGHQVAF